MARDQRGGAGSVVAGMNQPGLQAQEIALIRAYSNRFGVPPSLAAAMIVAESNATQNRPGGTTTSGAGAQGYTQLMPGTAQGLGVDPQDPRGNLEGGINYLAQQYKRFGGRADLAASAYNSGPGGAEAGGQVEGYSETQAYVNKVLQLEKQFRSTFSGSAAVAAPLAPTATQEPPPAPGGGGAAPQESAFAGAAFAPSAPSVGPLSSRAASGTRSIAQNVEAFGGLPPQPSPPPAPEQGPSPFAVGNQPMDAGAPAIGGLNAEFARRFKLLQGAVSKAGGSLYIFSGGRDEKHQAALYQAALKKYGDEATARKWVAPPGKSNHDTHAGQKYGLGDGAVASDLRGDLALAHKLAPMFGLAFPLSNEAWHIEMAGIRNMKA